VLELAERRRHSAVGACEDCRLYTTLNFARDQLWTTRRVETTNKGRWFNKPRYDGFLRPSIAPPATRIAMLMSRQDTLLFPLRVATSPTLLRAYLRTVLVVITSTVLLAFAVVAYTSFYYAYIPIRGISVPVYLQFDHGPGSPYLGTRANNVFGSSAGKWPYGIASVSGLVGLQKYDVVVSMVVPRSRHNLNAGNWMVGLDMRGPVADTGGVKSLLGWDDDWNVEDHSQGGHSGSTADKTSPGSSAGMLGKPAVLAKSRRPAILTYRSWVVEHAYRSLRFPLYLVGWHTESETIEVSMMEDVEFDKGAHNVPSSLRLELRSRQPLEVYRVAVRFSAKLEGLRWLMYQYRLSSLMAFTTLFWGVEMGVVLLTWAVFTMLFGSSTRAEEEEEGQDMQLNTKIKIERDNNIKLEKTESVPDTPLSDTSRTFPTLHSQQPLHYSSPSSPKEEERQSPALEDIPMREDAEADDEDDDFVLEEPLSRSMERESMFTDSGIGTSFEGERERERSVQRRKSGKMRDGRG
jgi:seipin